MPVSRQLGPLATLDRRNPIPDLIGRFEGYAAAVDEQAEKTEPSDDENQFSRNRHTVAVEHLPQGFIAQTALVGQFIGSDAHKNIFRLYATDRSVARGGGDLII